MIVTLPKMRFKAKLVLAITTMVVLLVAVFACLYVYAVVHIRMGAAYVDGDFVAHEIFNTVRQSLDTDLANVSLDSVDPLEVHAAIESALSKDRGLNYLLQSIVGYSPVIYDAAIVDANGVAFLHTDSEMQGKGVMQRPSFDRLLHGGVSDQLEVVFGKPSVYEIRMPLKRGGAPFGDIRVGLSTTFLKSELRPQLNRALAVSAAAILVSLLLAAGLSNLVLQPLEAIGRRLDRMSAGEFELAAQTSRPRSDEYGVVTNKIDRLGRQMRDVQEVFSALKENLDQIMANLQDGLMLFTRDWRVVLVSASAERFVGRPRGQMLGEHVDDVFSGESPLARAVLWAFHQHRTLATRELEDGRGRRVEVALDFIEERGERIGALLTMRDAESVRRIESEIELSRRLAGIGRLTSGVAHEVKNPINAIVVHLEVLREKLQDIDPAARRHMDVIGKEIQRLDRVVQTLVDFTRPMELKLAETDLHRLVEDVAALASPEAARAGVRVERALLAEPLPVKVDADLLKQALLNVVLNGVQAMPNGGELTIRTHRENGYAHLEIHDEGAGIPPEVGAKIFNLYFTTKKKGSGIGLSMTYRVMQLHNGSVDFESLPEQGTTFRLLLPLCDSDTAGARSPILGGQPPEAVKKLEVG